MHSAAILLAVLAARSCTAFHVPYLSSAPGGRSEPRVEPHLSAELGLIAKRLSCAGLLLLPTLMPNIAGASMMPAAPPSAIITSTSMTTASAFDATCFGFGCGPYQGTDFDGLPASEVTEPSITFRDFLQALDEKRVQKVEFAGPSADVAYATIVSSAADGGATQRIRIGEGFPVEKSKAWTSPLWVVRILKDKKVPYTLGFQLDTRKRASDMRLFNDPNISRSITWTVGYGK